MDTKKYIVRLEFDVQSIDLMDMEVEAESREDAIIKAKEKFDKGEYSRGDFHTSEEEYSFELSENTTCDWLVTEK